MKLMRTLLILVFAGLAWAQVSVPNPERTEGGLNCRFWRSHDNPNFRLGLIAGYADLWDIAQHAVGGSMRLPPVSYGEMRDGVTAVCAQPENGILMLVEAMALFAYKAEGIDNAALEDLAARFQRGHLAAPDPKQ
jgi:hypothetical protein